MSLLTDLTKEVSGIFGTSWSRRAGTIVPEADTVRLGNDAVELNGTVLYADLVESTALVDGYKDFFAAEVYKTYLLAACRVIRHEGGAITAFDGDRVMAVFIGSSKNSSAVRAALKINWALANVVNPSLKKRYSNVSLTVRHRIGIDTSALFVARTGIRGANDLVWVGRAANYAAKLAALDGLGPTIITEDVHSKLSEAAKFGGQPRKTMWERSLWPEKGLGVYESSWMWSVE